MLSNSDNYSNLPWSSSPLSSQNLWHNITGDWVPMIDAETNLDAQQSNGFDPRTPTLFNAAWLVSQLVDGAQQNLSSLIVYSLAELWPPASSPTERYGGWGDGMITEESTGVYQEFAPYWALDLWASAVPRGARELPLTDGSPSIIRSFAAGSSSEVSVIVVNRVGVDVTIPVSSSNSSWVAVGATTLDQTTYKMVYDSSTKTEQLTASGLGHPAPSDRPSMSLTLEGYGVGVVTFAPVPPGDHTASFSETGLPSGTNWSVTLGGVTHTSTGTKVTFTEPNGSYGFTIPTVPGYSSAPSKGTLVVKGNENQAVTFASKTKSYTVSFNESGLPTGTEWSVSLGSTNRSSPDPTIAFTEPNGKYDYSTGIVRGYVAAPSSGSITVQGGNQTQTVRFIPLLPGEYSVTFDESGLAYGSNWSVTLGTINNGTNTTQVAFTVVNGTYNYSVGPLSGFETQAGAGVVTILGIGSFAPGGVRRGTAVRVHRHFRGERSRGGHELVRRARLVDPLLDLTHPLLPGGKRVLQLLPRHGARVRHRNRLGIRNRLGCSGDHLGGLCPQPHQ